LLAVTVVLSGLDAGDDGAAMATVAEGWGIALADEHWDEIRTADRPVIANVFLAPGSSGDVVIRGGVACLGSAFGLLMGTGEE
jgi:hypothetical protein